LFQLEQHQVLLSVDVIVPTALTLAPVHPGNIFALVVVPIPCVTEPEPNVNTLSEGENV